MTWDDGKRNAHGDGDVCQDGKWLNPVSAPEVPGTARSVALRW